MPLLKYTGPRLSTGEPERSLIFSGIPEGDLDTDTLTEEQMDVVKRSGLYDQPKPGKKTESKE